jgi:hypothetical protein
MPIGVKGIYSIPSRVTGLQTSRGLNPTSFHPTQRFLWVGKAPYQAPNSTTPAPSMANQGKMRGGPNIRSPQTGL